MATRKLFALTSDDRRAVQRLLRRDTGQPRNKSPRERRPEHGIHLPPTRSATVYTALSAGSQTAPGKGEVKFDKPRLDDPQAYEDQDDTPIEVLNYTYAVILPGVRVLCVLNQPTKNGTRLEPRYAAVLALAGDGDQTKFATVLGAAFNIGSGDGGTAFRWQDQFADLDFFSFNDIGAGVATRLIIDVEGWYEFSYCFDYFDASPESSVPITLSCSDINFLQSWCYMRKNSTTEVFGSRARLASMDLCGGFFKGGHVCKAGICFYMQAGDYMELIWDNNLVGGNNWKPSINDHICVEDPRMTAKWLHEAPPNA